MYQSIGDVFLQTIGKINVEPASTPSQERQPVNVPFSITVTGKKKLQLVEIRGYTFNDMVKSRKEYNSDMYALLRETAYNRFIMEDADGYLLVTDIDIRNPEDEMNRYVILGKYLPASDWCEYYRYREKQMINTFNKGFPSYFVLPFWTQFAEIANKFGDSWFNRAIDYLDTPEGKLPIFNMMDYPNYGTARTSTIGQLTEGCVQMESMKYNISGDYAEWLVTAGIDCFPGNNYLEIDCKIEDSDSQDVTVKVTDSDRVIVYEHTFTVTGTGWQKIITDIINFNRIYAKHTIKITCSPTAGSFILGGFRIRPLPSEQYVRFNSKVPTCNKGECKVFDTVTPDETDKEKWKRVYGSHSFSGDVVFENATMQWRLRPEAVWWDTGVFTDRISGETGRLMPDEFFDSPVYMNIDRFSQDEIVFTFTLQSKGAMIRTACVMTPTFLYFNVQPRVSPENTRGWRLDMENNVSKGVLDPTIGSLVMFTRSSSISMIKSKLIAPAYTLDGICSNDGASKESNYSFAIYVLPRFTNIVGATVHNKNVTGEDYFVDGEYINVGRTIYLTDFINSLYECGPLTERRLGHKFYGDNKW